MSLYEKLWNHYRENTDLDLLDKGGVYDLMHNAESVDDGLGSGIALNLRMLDRHYGYDYTKVYGKDTVAIFDTDTLVEDNLTRAIVEKKLNGILDEMFPEWREDWEIPNHDAAHYVSAEDLMDELEYVSGGLDAFMSKFGYVRFSTVGDLWENPSYCMPIYEDPNQLKLPFGE